MSLSTSKINYMDPRVTVAWCLPPPPRPSFPWHAATTHGRNHHRQACCAGSSDLRLPRHFRCKRTESPIDNRAFFPKAYAPHHCCCAHSLRANRGCCRL